MQKTWNTALYLRLSRDDEGDRESNSIANQRTLLEQYIHDRPEFVLVDIYVDDGYTGTNFDRPDFRRMMADVDAGRVNCILVKDLSRFGRDYIGIGQYLEKEFPAKGVRFLALGDNVDSQEGYNMLLPMVNVLNTQYARDISKKVRTALQTRQKQGKFIGAFASYGYLKDPNDHNHLIPDPVAAPVVQRIFSLYEQGMGKLAIAKVLNADGIPCPSIYKQLQGEKYNNGQRLADTSYWTYATIHRLLQNPMYVGKMVQGRAPRQSMHGRAKLADPNDWVVVDGTHEPIIDRAQWERVQSLIEQTGRTPNFQQNVSIFAGVLRCGDCGRAMSKVTRHGEDYYCCGSYKRYGAKVCTQHWIPGKELASIVLADLNAIIRSVQDLQALEQECRPDTPQHSIEAQRRKLEAQLEQVRRRSQRAYEDYQDRLISREELQRYRQDYQSQEKLLEGQLEALEATQEEKLEDKPWVASLLQKGELDHLDRVTVAETISAITVFEDGHIEITYTFSDDLGLLDATQPDSA